MKYMRHLSLSLACVIAGALSAHSVQANVIPDASFENGTWRLQDNTMSIVDSPVRSGKKAFKIVNTGDGVHTAWSQVTTNIEPGVEYVYEAWVRGQNVKGVGGGGKPLGVVRWRDASKPLKNAENKATESYRWTLYGTYNFTTERMRMYMQAPSGARAVDFGIRTWNDTLSGFTVWDDLRMVPRQFPNRGRKLVSYQAESAKTLSGGKVDNHHHDASGSGYYDVRTDKAAV